MNNKDKYTVSKLTDAIDDAMNVSFNQMVDTVRTQCYMSQTETNWEECDELDNLGEHRKMGNVKDTITNEMKRVVISALTDSDLEIEDRLHKNSDEYQSQFETETERLEREDEEEYDISPTGKSKPSDSFGWDTPQIDGIPNGDTMSDTDDEDDLFHFGEYKHSNKFFQTNNKTHCYLNDSENSVMILALETLLEQVRDAHDFEQIARVKNLLDSWKTLDDSRK